MRVALAPWLDVSMTGIERIKALLFPAIDQVLDTQFAQGAGLQIAVALGLPEPRPGMPAEIRPMLMSALEERYPNCFSVSASFPVGHAAGLLALEAACQRLARGTLDACVVAGVDSYLHPETLEWLEQCDQLHGAGTNNNAWGFIPGEGAGALMLVRERTVEKLGIKVMGQILSVSCAQESKRIKTDTVCIGEGLTEAFRGALRILPEGTLISDSYCDMNGEPYRADEYGFAALRTKDHFQSASDFVAPADCWGDVAAAGAPLHIGLAVIAGQKAYANGANAFVWASSEQGQRGAAVVRVSAEHVDAR